MDHLILRPFVAVRARMVGSPALTLDTPGIDVETDNAADVPKLDTYRVPHCCFAIRTNKR